MNKAYIILFSLLLFTFNLISQKEVNKKLTIGETKILDSKILNEKRTLNIYLPYNYNPDSATLYNTIYLLDGSINEDFLHIVGLVQFFNLQFGMKPTIVVGIANIDRKRDFTFHTDLEELKKQFPTTGHSEPFISFLEKELIPFVESNYKTNKKKIIIGQSLGGLLATEVLLKKPNLFTDYWIVSPSLWWNNESLLEEAPSLLEKSNNFSANVYVAVGKQEDKIMRREAKAIYKILEKTRKHSLKPENTA